MPKPLSTIAVCVRHCLRLASLIALATSPGCSADDGASGEAKPAASPPTIFGGDRPVELRVPSSYDPATPVPLVVLLHGYGLSGQVQDMLFRLSSIADQQDFLFIAPNGTVDETGQRFWNVATLWCDSPASEVDDVAYVVSLIHEIEAAYAVDTHRIYLVGHSNGGAFAHAIACAHADEIAAFASLAGPLGANPATCTPSAPVAALHIHGTADSTVSYTGGSKVIAGSTAPCDYAGAEQTVAIWANANGCATATEQSTLDLDRSLPGEETTVYRHLDCPAQADAVLWSIEGGEHMPDLVEDFPTLVYGFLAPHQRP